MRGLSNQADFAPPIYGPKKKPGLPLKRTRRLGTTGQLRTPMAWTKEEKAQRRAAKAGPYPKPRGRAPRGSNGLPKSWDKERGGWIDAELSPWAWSSNVVLEAAAQHPEAEAAAEHVAATSFAAAPMVTMVSWEPLVLWQQTSCEQSTGSINQLHERVLLTPRGSRAHAIEYTSPGGTVREERFTSPAHTSATHERRCSWRSRIADARKEARGLVERYETQCTQCGRAQHIMPDGCMFPHSLRETIPRGERASYMEGPIYAERGWECPGSRVYFGACEVVSECEK